MQLNSAIRYVAVVLAALTLSACASRSDVPVSSLGEDDDAICRANNVAVGSSDYVACRKTATSSAATPPPRPTAPSVT